MPIVCDLIAPAELYQRQLQAASPAGAALAPLVIDVRGTREYAASHLAGAVNIPLERLESRMGEVPSDRLVVTYCNMHHPGQSRGEEAASLLAEHGHQVMALQGGYPAWKQAGLPAETTAGEPGAS
jgi:rhodanese-related sulfurtransferase